MVQVKTGGRSEKIREAAEHVLFVEGREEGLDQVVLRALLVRDLRVEVMGPSYSVRNAAQALAQHHPRYYFLIDRDYYDDEFVEKSWQDFPDPDKSNLLVWRRREIENYFLEPSFLKKSWQDFPDPDKSNLLVWRRREIENYFLEPSFLVKSAYCRDSETALEKTLVEAAQKRVFLDVANSVITLVREEQKRTWIEHFSDPADFASREAAVEQLISREEFVQRSERVSEMLLKEKLTQRFERSLAAMTGGRETLTYGTGQWVAMIRGKKVLPQLLNSRGFHVTDASNQRRTDKKMQQEEIVRELIKNNVDSLPEDLVKLKKLIQERMEST